MIAVSQEIETRAREIYEAARKNISGRPSWEKLNPNDLYDMSMKNVAFKQAEKELTNE